MGRSENLLAPPDLYKATVPTELGYVSERYQGKSLKTIIYLQDAHAIPAAQVSLRRLVEYFQAAYGVRTVALEGAEGKLDPTLFRTFPDSHRLSKVFEDYLNRGELAGGAVASVLSRHEATYLGIEDWKLYEKGIRTFLEALKRQPEFFKEIDRLSENLRHLKKKYYSTKAAELDSRVRAWDEKPENLAGLLNFLTSIRNLDVSSYPRLAAVYEGLRNETVESPQDLDREISKLVRKLQAKMADDQRIRELNAKLQAWQTNTLSRGAFAAYLSRLVPSRKISARLNRIIRIQSSLDQTRGKIFFDELSRYIRAIQHTVFVSDQERALENISRRLTGLRKLASFQLSYGDWKDLSAGVEMSSRDSDILALEKSLQSFSSRLDSDYKSFRLFYETALERDEVFSREIESLLKENHRNSLMLVTGGFHTDRLLEDFKQKGFSVLLISPRMDQVPSTNSYLDYMRGDVSWRDYFKPVRGKVNLFEAFSRATVDRLTKTVDARGWKMEGNQNPKYSFDLPPSAFDLLKPWRDQVIRYLALRGRLQEASKYTRFVENAARGNDSKSVESLKLAWSAKLERFIAGLRLLEEQNQITEANISRLLSRHANQFPVAVGSFVPGTEIAFPSRWRTRDHKRDTPTRYSLFQLGRERSKSIRLRGEPRPWPQSTISSRVTATMLRVKPRSEVRSLSEEEEVLEMRRYLTQNISRRAEENSVALEIRHAVEAGLEPFVETMNRLRIEARNAGMMPGVLNIMLYEATRDHESLRRRISMYYEALRLQHEENPNNFQAEEAFGALRFLGVGDIMTASPESRDAKAGGMADVIAELPPALVEAGGSVTVVTFAYQDEQTGERGQNGKHPSLTALIQQRGLKLEERPIVVHVGPTRNARTGQYLPPREPNITARVYTQREGDLMHIYLDSPPKTRVLYPAGLSEEDRIELMLLLSRGTLEYARGYGLYPHFIFANDWVAGLIPIYRRVDAFDTSYRTDPHFGMTQTIAAGHNLGDAYQMRLYTVARGIDLFPKLLISGEHYFGLADRRDISRMNIVQANFFHANAIQVVSPNYLLENLQSGSASRMDWLLRERATHAYGISNAIDMNKWRRFYDAFGRQLLGLSDFEGTEESFIAEYVNNLPAYKAAAQQWLQTSYSRPGEKYFGTLSVNPSMRVVSFIGRQAEQKGIELFINGIQRILDTEEDVQILLAGSVPDTEEGSPEDRYRKAMIRLAQDEKYRGRFVFHPEFIKPEQVYLAIDVYLMPSKDEPGGIAQLFALLAGAAVIGRSVGGIANTVRPFMVHSLVGDGFLFVPFEEDAFVETALHGIRILRHEGYRRAIIRNAAQADNSWESRVPYYIAMLQNEAGVLNYDYPHLVQTRELLREIQPHLVRSESRDETSGEIAKPEQLAEEDIRIVVERANANKRQAWDLLEQRGVTDELFRAFYWTAVEGFIPPIYLGRKDMQPGILADHMQKVYQVYQNYLSGTSDIVVDLNNPEWHTPEGKVISLPYTELICVALDRYGLDVDVSAPLARIGGNIQGTYTIYLPHPADPRKKIAILVREVVIDKAPIDSSEFERIQSTIEASQKAVTVQHEEKKFERQPNRRGIFRGKAAVLREFAGGIKDVAYDIYAGLDDSLQEGEKARRRAQLKQEDTEQFNQTLDTIVEQIKAMPGIFHITGENPHKTANDVVRFIEELRREILAAGDMPAMIRGARPCQASALSRFLDLMSERIRIKRGVPMVLIASSAKKKPADKKMSVAGEIESRINQELRDKYKIGRIWPIFVELEVDHFEQAFEAVLSKLRLNATGAMKAILEAIDLPEIGIRAEIIKKIRNDNMDAETAILDVIVSYLEDMKAAETGRMPSEYFEALSANARDFEMIFTRVYQMLHGKEVVKGEIMFHEAVGPTVLFAHRMNVLDAMDIVEGFPNVKTIVVDQSTTGAHWAQWIANKDIRVVALKKNSLGGIYGENLIGLDVVVDGNRGVVITNPTHQTSALYSEAAEIEEAYERVAKKHVADEVQTEFGRRFEIYATADTPRETEIAVENSAEGNGLVRTEYLFCGNILEAYLESFEAYRKNKSPENEERLTENQTKLIEYFKECFLEIAQNARGRPVRIRMFDVQPDKEFGLPQPKNRKYYGPAYYRYRRDLLEIEVTGALLAQAELREGEIQILFPLFRSPADLRAYLKNRPNLKGLSGKLQGRLNTQARFDILFMNNALNNAIEKVQSWQRWGADQKLRIRQVKRGLMIETQEAINILPFILSQMDIISFGTTDLVISLNRTKPDISRDEPKYADLFDELSPEFILAVREVLGQVSAANASYQRTGADRVISVSFCGILANLDALSLLLARIVPENVPFQIIRPPGQIASAKHFIRHIRWGDTDFVDRLDEKGFELQAAIQQKVDEIHVRMRRAPEVEEMREVIRKEKEDEAGRLAQVVEEFREPLLTEEVDVEGVREPDAQLEEQDQLRPGQIRQERTYTINGPEGCHLRPAVAIAKRILIPLKDRVSVFLRPRDEVEKYEVTDALKIVSLAMHERDRVAVEMVGSPEDVEAAFRALEDIHLVRNDQEVPDEYVFVPVPPAVRSEVRKTLVDVRIAEKIIQSLLGIRTPSPSEFRSFTQLVKRQKVQGIEPILWRSLKGCFEELRSEKLWGYLAHAYEALGRFKAAHPDFDRKLGELNHKIIDQTRRQIHTFLQKRSDFFQTSRHDQGLNFSFAFAVPEDSASKILRPLLRYIRMVKAIKDENPSQDVQGNIRILVTARMAGNPKYREFFKEIGRSGVAKAIAIDTSLSAQKVEMYLRDHKNAMVYGLSEFPVSLNLSDDYRNRIVESDVPLEAVLPVAMMLTHRLSQVSMVAAALLEKVPDILPGVVQFDGHSLRISHLALEFVYDAQVRELFAKMA
ncbi:MAG: glycogen/starch synthase [Candidatus Omnitrophica bacterium]|nr:glycogen/starch synthase [Candidatus Omnitrophota bacterium]